MSVHLCSPSLRTEPGYTKCLVTWIVLDSEQLGCVYGGRVSRMTVVDDFVVNHLKIIFFWGGVIVSNGLYTRARKSPAM